MQVEMEALTMLIVGMVKLHLRSLKQHQAAVLYWKL